MEEIPGEEAFPAYLDSSIKNIYERAGMLRCPDGSIGSLTMIGTVSPAGGNFDEPVTQATLGTVKTFLGLSSDRAYRRYYPAIDPLLSWSRYLEQLADWFAPSVSMLTISALRDLAAPNVSKATAAESAPGRWAITSTSSLSPQACSCSMAAALKVSAAPSTTSLPSSV